MKIHNVKKEKMKIPPKYLIKEYLVLGPPMKFESNDIKKNFKNENTKNQFLNKATDFNLVVRLKRGSYFAPKPDIAIKTWGMDDYYRRLISLNSAFEYLDFEYTFYCMSSSHYTDYAPEKVIPVFKQDHEEIDQNHIDHFVYDFSGTNELQLEAFETTFTIPILSREETALLLLSTYGQREVNAGSKIFENIELTSEMKAVLAGLGYERYGEGEFREIKIKRPQFIQKWIEEIGFENVKERAGK